MSSEQAGSSPRGADLRIAISGKSGCGNTTVSRLVASRLGLRVVNYTFKDLARDKGMSFTELIHKAEDDPQYDGPGRQQRHRGVAVGQRIRGVRERPDEGDREHDRAGRDASARPGALVVGSARSWAGLVRAGHGGKPTSPSRQAPLGPSKVRW